MMTTGICAGARAGMAAHGHPKTAQSHRNHEQRCYRSPPSLHPSLCSLLPLFSGTPNTASQSWQHEMGAASVRLLQTLTSESHIPLCLGLVSGGCSSAAYRGKLVNTKIINALHCQPKCIWDLFPYLHVCSTIYEEH